MFLASQGFAKERLMVKPLSLRFFLLTFSYSEIILYNTVRLCANKKLSKKRQNDITNYSTNSYEFYRKLALNAKG